MQGFFNAIRARKIDRAAAFYAVAGWALVQGAAIALPLFGAPQWSLRALIALVAVGFPLTLAFVWVAAPHPNTSKKAHLPPAARHTDIVLLIALGLVFAAIATQLMLGLIRPTSAIRTFHSRAAIASKPALALSGLRSNPTSIAVLPFMSMSADPSNRYFSAGISAELISELSHVPDLRVAARASSFSFQDKSTDVTTIAHALKVGAVLDGSVRVEGTRVRIEAELSSDDGFTIWSQTYDGELSHILDLQDEIASAITEALTHRLLGKSEFSAGRPASINPEAYREYLEARYDFAQRNDASVANAIDLLKQVTALQPNFADGFAALAMVESASAFDFGHREFIGPAQVAVQATLRLDPGISKLSLRTLRCRSHAGTGMPLHAISANSVRLACPTANP